MNFVLITRQRALTHIRDYVAQLQRESRLKRLGHVVFAGKTKEDLADLRRELEGAQMVFMTSNFCAIRVGVQAIAVQTATSDKLPQAQGGKSSTGQWDNALIWDKPLFFTPAVRTSLSIIS
ncbi:hypothetical protein PQX77_003663 [Marasmius sp. AFHP31]|nr:hypothetical protein PQX77_003663 [Marasmius sp. AFHP31]